MTTAPTTDDDQFGLIEVFSEIYDRLDALERVAPSTTSARKSRIGALLDRLFGNSNGDTGADCDREGAAASQIELGDAPAAAEQVHETGLDIRTSGPFFEGPVFPGVVHVHCHGHDGLHSSVVGTPEGSDSAGPPSGDPAESLAHVAASVVDQLLPIATSAEKTLLFSRLLALVGAR